MDLEVRHLKLVVAIAEEGSVTRAGGRLHLTQSALSHQLKDIEGRLGTPLFHRVGRRMVLTQQGERLLASARSLLPQLARAEEDLRAAAGGEGGLLRLSTECYTCYHWLPVLLKEFGKRHPKIEVRIDMHATKDPVAALLAGRLDLAIALSPVADRRLKVTSLFQDELVVVMAPDHPLASRSFIRPGDFKDENLYTYSTPEDSLFFQQVLVPAGVVPRQVTQAPLTEAIVELVKAGLGIAVMARWAIAPELLSGRLRGARLTQAARFRSWSAVRLKSAAEPAWLGEFVDLLSRDPLGVIARERRRKAPLARNAG